MNSRPRAFTLVEILVVLAIIAVLAAILLPVFNRVREKGRQASCQENEKQILLAVHMYAQDNDNYFPRSYYHTIGIPLPPPGSQIVTWYEVLLPYTKSQQVFQCPTDSGTAIGGQWKPGPKFHSSYAASTSLLVGGNTNIYNAPRLMSRVKKPATCVFLSDAGTQINPTPPFVTADSPAKKDAWSLSLRLPESSNDVPNCGPSLRHSGRSNVAFVDGHVKAMRPEQWFYKDSKWMTPEGG